MFFFLILKSFGQVGEHNTPPPCPMSRFDFEDLGEDLGHKFVDGDMAYPP